MDKNQSESLQELPCYRLALLRVICIFIVNLILLLPDYNVSSDTGIVFIVGYIALMVLGLFAFMYASNRLSKVFEARSKYRLNQLRLNLYLDIDNYLKHKTS